MTFTTAVNVVALIAGAGGIVALIWLVGRGNPERDAEQAARDYFDAHGRWPDEPPS